MLIFSMESPQEFYGVVSVLIKHERFYSLGHGFWKFEFNDLNQQWWVSVNETVTGHEAKETFKSKISGLRSFPCQIPREKIILTFRNEAQISLSETIQEDVEQLYNLVRNILSDEKEKSDRKPDPSKTECFRDLLSKPSEERNFALIVENQSLWVSKEVLSMASTVFRNMFYGDFKERHVNSVELPDKRLHDIVEMLSCLFLYSERKEVDDKNVEVLSQMADYFDIEVIKFRCSAFLKQKVYDTKDFDKLWPIFESSIKWRFKDVIKICIPRLATLTTVEIRYHQDKVPNKIMNAMLEAKSNRLDLIVQEHDLQRLHSDGNFYNDECSFCSRYDADNECSKCGKNMCYACTNTTCRSCHELDCKYRNLFSEPDVVFDCLCGYDFNDDWLTCL